MTHCYFCEEKTVIICDWCNYSFCSKYWQRHTDIEGTEIEAKERDAGLLFN